MFLDSGKCFGFWDVFLDSGKRFGFWKAFSILGSVFGFWEAFWMLGTVLSLRATVDGQSRSMFQRTVFFKQVSLMEFHFFRDKRQRVTIIVIIIIFLNLLVACPNRLTYSG